MERRGDGDALSRADARTGAGALKIGISAWTGRKRTVVVCLLLAMLAAFGLGIRLIHLDLPGPDADEIYMQYCWVLIKNNVFAGADALRLFGRIVPLALSNNDGMLPAYLLGILYAWGNHPLTFRVFSMAWLPLAVLFIYLLARQLGSSRRAAVFAAALMTVAPASYLYSRISYGFSKVGLTLAILYGVHRFATQNRARDLYLASFVIGVGLNIRLEMIYLVPVAAAWWLLVSGRPSLRQALGGGWARGLRRASLAIAAFLLGATPFWIFVARNFGPWINVYITRFHRSANNVDNTDIAGNLYVRWGQLLDWMKGTVYSGNDLRVDSPIALYVFWGAVGYAAFRVVTGWWLRKRAVHFELLMAALVLIMLQATKTPSTLHEQQVLVVLPLGLLLVALVLDDVARYRYSRPAAWAIALVLIAVNGHATYLHIRGLPENPGKGNNTYATFALVRYLEDEGIARAGVFSWGMDRHIYTFTNGGIKTIWILDMEGLMKDLEAGERNRAWVFHSSGGQTPGQRAMQVSTRVYARQRPDMMEHVIVDKYGPAYEVFTRR